MNGSIKRVLLLMAVCLTASCQRWEDRYLTRPVSETELIGRWQMTTASVDDLRRVGHVGDINPARHTITLRSGGACHFATFLTALTPQQRPSQSLDRECAWTIQNEGRQKLLIDLSGDPPLHTHLYFGADESGRLLLWRNATDPDLELSVEYERRN